MEKKALVMLGVVALAIIFLAYNFGQGVPVTAVNGTDSIKIGVISPLTGVAASYGDPAAKSVSLASDEINANGGILGKSVELIIEDGKCDGKTTSTAASKLITIDHVSVILGGHCSTESLVIAPIANKNKVLQIASITTSDLFSRIGQYSFRNSPSSSYFFPKFGAAARDYYNSSKLAALYEQKDFPLSVYKTFKVSYVKNGGVIVSEQSFESGEQDFRTYLLAIKLSGADSIMFSPQAPSEMILFLKQAYELGMLNNYTIFTNPQGVTPEVNEKAHGLLSDKVVTSDAFVSNQNDETRKYLYSYEAKYGSFPATNLVYAVSSYDALYLVKHAMEECRSSTDTDCMVSSLRRIKKWNGAAGAYNGFNDNGDMINQTIAVHYFDSNGTEEWRVLN